jgi:hypothetical protein
VGGKLGILNSPGAEQHYLIDCCPRLCGILVLITCQGVKL